MRDDYQALPLMCGCGELTGKNAVRTSAFAALSCLSPNEASPHLIERFFLEYIIRNFCIFRKGRQPLEMFSL